MHLTGIFVQYQHKVMLSAWMDFSGIPAATTSEQHFLSVLPTLVCLLVPSSMLTLSQAFYQVYSSINQSSWNMVPDIHDLKEEMVYWFILSGKSDHRHLGLMVGQSWWKAMVKQGYLICGDLEENNRMASFYGKDYIPPKLHDSPPDRHIRKCALIFWATPN